MKKQPKNSRNGEYNAQVKCVEANRRFIDKLQNDIFIEKTNVKGNSEPLSLSTFFNNRYYVFILNNFVSYQIIKSTDMFDLVQNRVEITSINSGIHRIATLMCVNDLLHYFPDFFTSSDVHYLSKIIQVESVLPQNITKYSYMNNVAVYDVMTAIFTNKISHREQLFDEYYCNRILDAESMKNQLYKIVDSGNTELEHVIFDQQGRLFALTGDEKKQFTRLTNKGIKPEEFLDKVWAKRHTGIYK